MLLSGPGEVIAAVGGWALAGPAAAALSSRAMTAMRRTRICADPTVSSRDVGLRLLGGWLPAALHTVRGDGLCMWKPISPTPSERRPRSRRRGGGGALVLLAGSPVGRARRRVVVLLIAIGCGTSVGCGEATVGTGTGTVRTDTVHAAATSAPAAKREAVVARIDASSDAIVAEGKLHIAAGAPSDAEVRREIAAARKAGIVLPSGDNVQSFLQAPKYTVAAAVGTPEVSWNPRSKPIADWIIPVLEWAYLHGWTGTVTSGYRTYYEQAQLNAAGAFSAPAGSSNHETTVYPGGAVDVTESAQLIAVLRGYPGPMKLVGGVLGPIDPEHFSATGD